jgi:hypothetical protein
MTTRESTPTSTRRRAVASYRDYVHSYLPQDADRLLEVDESDAAIEFGDPQDAAMTDDVLAFLLESGVDRPV